MERKFAPQFRQFVCVIGKRNTDPVLIAFAASHICRYHGNNTGESDECNQLLKHLVMKIKSTGPITVAEYMKEVLTNPIKGYYMHHDMLGEHGDFVTSPEISQVFGELIGIWCISEWMSGGKSKSLKLVELGPGKGSLMDDILRVFSQFQHLLNSCDISIHLVEVSPKLSEIQTIKLTGKNIETIYDEDTSAYKKGITKSGLEISWYHDVQDVPAGYTFFIAHEFFDALPIHKLQKTSDGWREILIDIDPEVPNKLRFVLGSSISMLARTFIQADEKRDHIEISPNSAVIIQKLASQINNFGGAALIADYGHSGDKTDTFRGFGAHQLHDVLIDPGTADLTADVDFSFLKKVVGNTVVSLGPITQQEFLKNMGIDLRMKVLLENNKCVTTQQHLKQSYDILMNPCKMGQRFKFFSMFPHSRMERINGHSKVDTYPVAGFTELQFN
ncbi:protein arginine methyltransferase NDUFAF7, mitochondrial isoform X1 [Bufo bufo]|uniref:protein arginine methyltransferase NDUFAF7, mitochondrial isoform X1 n=1 Tax=Bufo bufo TaxID=8384 RepID=UPI001ABE24E5|nr:protein arginine methyltransferase NDUFAF7, mitochondrial isoform X1 [Bufo bufo]